MSTFLKLDSRMKQNNLILLPIRVSVSPKGGVGGRPPKTASVAERACYGYVVLS